MRNRVRSIILVFLFLPALTGCVTMRNGPIGGLVNTIADTLPIYIPISEDEETVIGRNMAAEVAGRYTVLSHDDLTRYVNLVGNAVAHKSDRPNLPYHFAVLDSEIINAFSCPGGYIFISKGALRIIGSEAELAAVLSHEIAHVAKRHIVHEIEKAKFFKAGDHVAGGLLRPDTILFKRVTDFGNGLVFKGLSRSDEYEADRLALKYLSRTGYDPSALLWFIEKLASASSNPSFTNVELLFSTHPKTDDRIERITKILDAHGETFKTGAVLSERYQEATYFLR